jgi:aspartate kinase
MLVTVGERVSIALLAMALDLVGVPAVSLTGSQSGILTSDRHAEARIVDVRPKRIVGAIEAGKVAIVAGFQGMSRGGEITSLGRGGSDTSAVAIGAALGAEAVEFYKDVAGIFSADPKKEQGAVLYPYLDYDDAYQLAQQGAKILHPRSILLAKKNRLPLCVRNFRDPSRVGTQVGRRGERTPEVEFERDDPL